MTGMSELHRHTAPDRERLIQRIEAALAPRQEVVFALVFGSFLHQDAFHDIDLAIWTTASADPRADIALAAELSASIGLPVDARRINDAPVAFLFHALRGRPVLVRDPQLLADVMERTARDYHDRAPLLARATREAFAR